MWFGNNFKNSTRNIIPEGEHRENSSKSPNQCDGLILFASFRRRPEPRKADGITQTGGNISPKHIYFSYLVKILKVFTGKNLQPGIGLWVWIPAFVGMTLLNLG
jgi:hypothetical protein